MRQREKEVYALKKSDVMYAKYLIKELNL